MSVKWAHRRFIYWNAIKRVVWYSVRQTIRIRTKTKDKTKLVSYSICKSLHLCHTEAKKTGRKAFLCAPHTCVKSLKGQHCTYELVFRWKIFLSFQSLECCFQKIGLLLFGDYYFIRVNILTILCKPLCFCLLLTQYCWKYFKRIVILAILFV